MSDPVQGTDSFNREIAKYTKWLAGFTFLLFVATGYLVWYAAEQSKDLKESISITRSTFIGDQRPWIGGPEASYVEGRPTFTFTNTGKTATTGLYINGDFADSKNRFTILKEKCAEADRHTHLDNGFGNYSITPNGHLTLHDLAPDDLFSKQNTAIIISNYEYVVGCVTYGSPFDDKRHQTGFEIPINKGKDGNISFGETASLFPN